MIALNRQRSCLTWTVDAGNPYRRAHDTSLMHHNPAMLAASTGRKDVGVMVQRYMKPNRASVYEALTQPEATTGACEVKSSGKSAGSGLLEIPENAGTLLSHKHLGA